MMGAAFRFVPTGLYFSADLPGFYGGVCALLAPDFHYFRQLHFCGVLSYFD